MITPPKAYSYIRFSTPEQQNGDSFRRQYELSKAYAETHGLILDERLSYRDLGVSAFDKSNVRDGQLGVFLEAIDSGAVPAGSYLLVESLDRISRARVSDAVQIFLTIINRGITIVTLADGMEYSKEKVDRQFTDLIISIAIMSRAHEESLTKSKRLKAAWQNKRAGLGQKKLTSLAPGWLELSRDKSEYLPISHRVGLVQDIFEWTKNGLGAGSIAKRLNQNNVPTFGSRANNTWHTSYVQKILANRSVLGEFQPHVVIDGKRVPEGDPIPDYFPRIISNEDFLLAHAAQQSRKTGSAGRKGASLSNLFSGIVKCGYCKGSMVYMDKGHTGPRSKMLVCGAAKAGKGCHYIPWEYPLFEQSVLAYCRGVDVEKFLQQNDRVKSELTELHEKVVLLQASLTEIESKETNILAAIESGAKYQLYESRARQLEQERIRVEFELLSTQKQYDLRTNAKINAAEVQATIDELLKQMSQLSGDRLYDLRAALSQQVKRVIARIAMYPGGYMDSPRLIAAYRDHATKQGYSENEVTGSITANFKVAPRPAERFFVLGSHNGMLRQVQSTVDAPEVLDVGKPDAALAENVQLIADKLGAMIQNIEKTAKGSTQKS